MHDQTQAPKRAGSEMRAIRLRRPVQPQISTVVLVAVRDPRAAAGRFRWRSGR